MIKYKYILLALFLISVLSSTPCLIYFHTQCSQCAQSYYLATNYTCLPCPNGCLQCITNDICTNCMSNYYLLDDICQPGPNNCLIVQNNGDCSVCLLGFFLNNNT